LSNRGASLDELGFHEEAITCHQQALALDPNDVETHINLGIAYCSQGRVDEGISEYKVALTLNPNYAEAHNNLGRAYFDQGKLDEAVSEYREALRLDSSLTQPYENLGYVRMEEFAKFVAGQMMAPLLKGYRIGPSGVDRKMALRPVGMAFTLGYVVATSHRAELEEVLHVSLKNLSEMNGLADLSKRARVRGDNLIEIILGTVLSRLSVSDAESVEIALVSDTVSNAYKSGLKLGLDLPGSHPDADREFKEVTSRAGIYPGDDAIHLIIGQLIGEYATQMRNDQS
jgi:tetratricopeptide (TPR) repeat protein